MINPYKPARAQNLTRVTDGISITCLEPKSKPQDDKETKPRKYFEVTNDS